MYLPTDRCLMGLLVEGRWLKKRCVLLFILIFAFTSIVFGIIPQYSIANTGDDGQKDVLQKALNLQVPFIANQGQIADKTIQFYARTLGGGVYIRQNGEIIYTFSHTKSSARSFLKENLINASQVTLKGKIPSSTKVSYYLGNDKQKWHTRINSYDEINFGDVYEDIELKLRAYGKNVEKIFTVRPGADPERIRLNIPAADSLIIKEDGKLEIINGKEKVRFSKPIAYQEINGKRTEVQVAYFAKDTIYGFDVGEYNKSHPLIIDPSLTDVSYIGGDNEDVSYGIVMDQSNGDIYIAGSTNSWPFYYGPYIVPTTEIVDSYYSGVDSFVMKISDNGNALTYLGGESDDFCYGIALGEQGSTKYVYLTGQTYSKKFPALNGFDRKIGGNNDAWVARMKTDLSLDCSTYIGGGGDDTGYAIAVDDDGSAYVTGETLSSNFPIPVPGVAFANSKGKVDAFVAKFEFTSSTCDLIYSTYLGGNGEDRGFDIIVGPDNLIYVTGQTSSPDFYTSDSPLSNALKGTTDVYLTVFKADLGPPVNYSSYIGGYGDESGEEIVIDDLIYLTGWTSSSGSWLPCDESVSDCTPNGAKDAFLIGLEKALSGDTVSYFTYIGFENDDFAYDMAVSNNGNILLTGKTISGSGDADFFVAELQVDSGDYTIESLGGASEDIGFGLSVDVYGDIYVTGSTYGFPGEELDDKDAFVAVLCEDSDDDGVCDSADNCPDIPNGYMSGTCTTPLYDEEAKLESYKSCVDDDDCENLGICSLDQENHDNEADEIGSACDSDDDNDGMPDWWESKYGSDLNPLNGSDWDQDPDGDGLINLHEFENKQYNNNPFVTWSTNPLEKDSDWDGWSDLMEVQAPTDPTESEEVPGSEIFKDGVYVVDPTSGNDNNLGTQGYPLVSIHAAVDRINMLEPWPEDEPGNYMILLVPGTYMPKRIEGDPIIEGTNYWVESDTPLVVKQDVLIMRNPAISGDVIIFSPNTLDENDDPQKAVNWKSGFIFSPGVEQITLKDVIISEFEQGVVFNSSSGCATLEDITIEACKEGVKLVETFQLNLSLLNTTILGCETGVNIETESSDNTILGGTILSTNIGVAVKGGTGNHIFNTDISDFGDEGTYGIKIFNGAESLAITGGTIEYFDVGIGFETDGFELTISENARIQGCRAGIEFLENYLVNVNMMGTTNDDPVITGCDMAVLFTAGSANNTFSYGSLLNNDQGIVFQACAGDMDGEAPDDNQITGTRIEGNFLNGVSVNNGSGNRFENCIISGSETGVAFLDGSDNQLVSSAVTNNDVGVLIGRHSSGNVIRGEDENDSDAKVENNGTDNFQIDGDNNLVENITLSSGNGLGHISGENNLLSGITIEGAGDGTGIGLIVPGGDVHLNNVIIKKFNVGVGFDLDAACLTFSGASEITGCDTCETGILIDEKYMLNIDLGNIPISDFERGVSVLGGSSNNTITGGVITLNRTNGIHVEPGSEYPAENRFVGIDVVDNGLNGIALLGGFDNQVIGCTIENNNAGKASEGYGGLVLLNGSGSIERCRISNNGCAGIYADEVSVANISGNLINHNTEGIHLGFTNNVSILSNTIAINEDTGLFMEVGSSPIVQYNIIYNNSTLIPPPDPNDPNVPDERYDIFFEGQFDATNLNENNIRLISKIDLPPSNLSVNPMFTDPDNPGDPLEPDDGDPPDFMLENISACIDATGKTEPGMDLGGRMRPRGFSWDMGAFESSGFADVDDDGMFDSWEQAIVNRDSRYANIFQFLPDDDADLDGISNLDEFKQGSDPLVPVNIVITEPSNRPYFTNTDSLSIVMSTINATEVVVSTGGPVTYNENDDTWSSIISGLEFGNNVILVTARGIVNNVEYTATDSLTVVRDNAFPTLTVINPTTGGSYSTALASITFSGFASDDTAIESVTWVNGNAAGTAEGTASWSTGPIELTDGVNIIQITAVDIFGKSGMSAFQEIEVTKQAKEAIENVEEDLSEGHTSNVMDDLDTDGDNFANDDEVACGMDPYIPNIVDPGAEPALSDFLYSVQSKYENGEKAGLYIPDCLNPDIDRDGLPNWWEEQYFPGAPLAYTAGDDGDQDSCDNLCEYERGTDPTDPQTIAFDLEVLGAFDEQGNPYSYDPLTWLPKFGHTLEIRAIWNTAEYGAPPSQAVFSLKQTSSYPGRAVNDPDPADLNGNDGYPDWYYDDGNIDRFNGPDFGLTATRLNGLADCGSGSVKCFDQGNVAVPPELTDGNTYIIYIHAWDFGGRTNLLVTDDGAGNNIGLTWIPEGSHKNGIGSAWKIGRDLDGDGARDVIVAPDSLDPNADIDAIVFENSSSYTAPLGDDFSNFEEYRGIVYTPTIGGTLEHVRLDPFRKDLFIRAQGFDDAAGSPYIDDRPLPQVVDNYFPFRMGKAFFNAGINVHNTTDWGHDATEDRSSGGTGERPFYVYYKNGTITEIVGDTLVKGSSDANWVETWPKHEWEFKLVGDSEDQWTPIGYWRNTDNGDGSISHELGLDFDYVNVTSGTYAYEIRKPLPHINILIIRNDHEGTYWSQTGSIQFISASSPSPQNPLGTRYWRWSTKGYAWCQTTSNQESMYGLAVTLTTPLLHYFDDTPYLDGSTWISADQDWDKVWNEVSQQWDIVKDGVLNPLSMVEDRTDQLDPIDGVMGDTPDGYWDGDKRLSDFSGGDLNPFDINGNELVELPVASGLGNIVNEYSLYEVFMHTTTHEIGHALAGPTHTNDPACLMYKYSNNWGRADNLSDIYRSLLRVHNITR